jgi:excisionase family DNA binding protein
MTAFNPLDNKTAPKNARARSQRAASMNFFTVAEVAERLEVSTRTVRRWIASGKLVAHHFGRAVRIAESDLKAFIAQHRDG